MLISLKSFLWYIYLTLLPLHLNFVHRLPGGFLTYNYHDLTFSIATRQSFWHWSVLLSLGLIFLLLVTAYTIRTRHRFIAFSLLWFFTCLLPVMNIIPTSVSFSERYAYAASFGFCFLLANLFFLVLRRFPHLTLPVCFLIIALIIFYTLRTHTRNTHWQNPIEFWERLARQYPDHLAVHLNLAQTYQLHQQPDSAIAQYYYLLTLKPDYAQAYLYIGQIHQYYGRFPEALDVYDQALALDNTSDQVLYYKSLAHYYLARQQLTDGHLQPAITNLYTARRLNPNLFEATQLLDQLCTQDAFLCDDTNLHSR